MVVCMTEARQRDTSRHAAPKRYRKVAAVAMAAAAVTSTAVAVGVVGSGAPDTVRNQSTDLVGASERVIGTVDLDRLAASRTERASRTASRTAKRITLEPQATDHQFATAKLNIWTQPREKGKNLGLIEWGSRLAVTGQVVGHWAEILVKGGQVRWVNADYLADKKPKPEPEPEVVSTSSTPSSTTSSNTSTSSGISSAPCPDGSSIESGLTSSATTLYRAVCAAFPLPTTYGGLDAHGEHVDGRAIDIMVSGAYGQQIADWLRANAGTLQIRDIIYAQQIWTPDRAAEGWRYMSDRGSTTANHYDHVHVAVY
jgi:hypothetical protein